MGQRVIVVSKVNDLRSEAIAKASLNRASKFTAIDPKPGDLSMVRVKVK